MISTHVEPVSRPNTGCFLDEKVLAVLDILVQSRVFVFFSYWCFLDLRKHCSVFRKSKHGSSIYSFQGHKSAVSRLFVLHTITPHDAEPASVLLVNSKQNCIDNAIRYEASSDDSFHSLLDNSSERGKEEALEQWRGQLEVRIVSKAVSTKVSFR